MPVSILVTGGCRSGKSSHALEVARELASGPRIFIATCVPYDDEMRERVRRHQEERGSQWQTLDVPVELAEAVSRRCSGAGVVLIDCLTLWVSNLMASCADDDQILDTIAGFCRVIADPPCPIVLVSNEVGCGVVPANAISRRFRDLMGWTNQRVAAAAHRVIWMVSGIAVTVKPEVSQTA
jgi:adenosylcobinamide kinase / adenosylcobinamide-phosphate guanylyltransferase